MRLISSPLRYPGGKAKAVAFLAQFFPDFKELREPMCGGASITLYWAQVKPKAKYIISDINYDLYCFWKELKHSPEKLIKEIYAIKKAYKDGKKLFAMLMERRNEDKDDFTRAVEFFVLNRITFSGTVDCGGYSEEAFRKRFTDSAIEKLWAVSKILSRIEVAYGDYEEFMLREGEDVLIFLDPPYYTSKNSRLYGKRGDLHTDFDHIRLSQIVKQTKHKVLITYDNSPYIRSLYSGFYVLSWKLKYGMTNYRKTYLREGDELLIANFPLDKAIDKLKKQPSLFQRVVSYSL